MRCAKGPRSMGSNDNHSSRGGSSTSFLWTSVKCHWHCDPLLHAYAIFWRAIDGPPRELFCLFVCLFVCFFLGGGVGKRMSNNVFEIKDNKNRNPKISSCTVFSKTSEILLHFPHTQSTQNLSGSTKRQVECATKQVSRKLIGFAFLSPS